MAERWQLKGDWFDVCRCRSPCGCTFAQAPDEGQCDGILAWHINEGSYGDVTLDDLSVVAIGTFEGNIWTGEAKPRMGFVIDERADDSQRQALQAIFGGEAGGCAAGVVRWGGRWLAGRIRRAGRRGARDRVCADRVRPRRRPQRVERGGTREG